MQILGLNNQSVTNRLSSKNDKMQIISTNMIKFAFGLTK